MGKFWPLEGERMKNSGRTQARKCVRSLASLFLLLLAGAAFGAGYSATAQTLRLTATPNVIKPTSGKAASSITLSVQPDKEEQCDQKPAIDLTNDTLMIAGNAGITLSSQPTTKGKCLIAYTATIDPNVYPGNYKLILLDLNKNNLGFAEITIVDPAAGPLPPGLRPEVDVLWEVMSQKSCSDVFGSRVAERNYCIQLKVGNNSGYALQVAGIGFSTQLDALKDPRNDTGTVTIANSSYASTRAVLLTENVTSGRNIAYNILQATGVLMSAFTPYFGTGKHPNGTINNARTNWSTAASIVSGPLLSAFNIIAPNPVITQLNNLDDQSFRTGTSSVGVKDARCAAAPSPRLTRESIHVRQALFCCSALVRCWRERDSLSVRRSGLLTVGEAHLTRVQ